MTQHVERQDIPINQLLIDDANPNRMTDSQQAGLKKVIADYGFAQDVWVVKRGDRYVVIDGAHRVAVLVDNGAKTAPCRVFPESISERDIKILRQVGNKLRGQHDPALDLAEYAAIQNTGDDGLAALAEYVGRDAMELADDMAQMQYLSQVAGGALDDDDTEPLLGAVEDSPVAQRGLDEVPAEPSDAEQPSAAEAPEAQQQQQEAICPKCGHQFPI